MEQLLQQNQQVANDLELRYDIAKKKRDQVRTFIRDNTCEALGISSIMEEDPVL